MSTDYFKEILQPRVALGVVTVGLLTLWIKQRYRGNQPPGPTPLPLVGNIITLAKNSNNLHEALADMTKTYGPVIQLSVGPIVMVFLNSTEVIKECFVKQGANFSGRPLDKMYIQQLLMKNGEGVVWASEGFKEIRKFTLVSLRGFGLGKTSLEDRVRAEAEVLCRCLGDMAKEPFDVGAILQKAISNMICSVAFGKRYDYDDEEFTNYLRILNEQFSSVERGDPAEFYPIFTKFWIPKRVKESMARIAQLFNFVETHVEAHRETFDPNDIRDFVDLYLEAEAKQENDSVSLNNFKQLILNIFAAGTETTATTLKWAFILMMNHKEIQKKCREEITSVYGTEELPTYKDRARLPYTEATILEIQRIGNTTPTSLPHSTLEDAEVGGYTIKKGSIVFANLYAVHMNPKNFDDPKVFKPERWLDQDNKIIKHEAFLPFGIGPRVCLGEALARMEMFMFFCGVMQHFQIDFEPNAPKPTLADNILGITLTPKPFKMKLTPI